MPLRRVFVALVALALVSGACGDDGDDASEPTTTTTTSTTTSTTTTATTTSPTTTSVTPATSTPEPVCDVDAAYAVAGAAIATARLEPGGEWSTDTATNPFDERTNSGDEFADRLALDCSVTAAQTTDAGADRLLLAAWTGPRIAFVIQASDGPAEPYAPDALVTVLTESAYGEYFFDDDSRWAAVLEGGETVILGHDDYNLGATAKAWQTAAPPFEDAEPTIEAERYGIATLRAAGQRNVSVAEAAQFGSEEGALQYVSPTGQIGVANIAPEGRLDPSTPRFYTGPSRTETIDGVEVRVTEPAPDDFIPVTAEVAWACADWVWLLQPAPNGTIDELVDTARAVIATETCQVGEA